MYVEVPHHRSYNHGSKSEFTKPKNELSIDNLRRISNGIELEPIKTWGFHEHLMSIVLHLENDDNRDDNNNANNNIDDNNDNNKFKFLCVWDLSLGWATVRYYYIFKW